MMRKSDVFLVFAGLVLAFCAMAFVHARIAGEAAAGAIELQARMVKHLELTDLCLFTEARYTRHPSQSDRHTPFQDHPFSLEHFPSGSIVGPPPVLMRGN